MATIGDQLIAPESGYQRYDDSNSKILYNGSNWTRADNISDNGGSHIATTNLGDVITFNFYSTKLRIISPINSGWSDNTQITIDGIIYNFSQYSSTLIFKTLVFEKLDLEEGIHTVEIKNITSGKYIGLDAIDIDENGYLLHPVLNQVSSEAEAQEGDCIPIRYTALTSGQVGFFSELGTCIADEIPVTGTTTPDGLAYLIMVGYDYMGRKMFVPDRNLQTGISWDALNNAGLVTGNILYNNNAIPFLTSNTSNGIAFASQERGYAYKAFDNNYTSDNWATNIGTTTGQLGYEFVESKIICGYGIATNTVPTTGPKDWTFEGWDGSQWIVLDTKVSQTSFTANTLKWYYFSNNTPYKKYRINVSANGGSSENYLGIRELKMAEKIISNDYSIRLLTGGISSTDTDNEWDNIIVNSNLNGTITAGDNNIWNWNGIYSWTSTTYTVSNIYRTQRGSTSVLNSRGIDTTETSGVGFRPVILVESYGGSNKFLIKQGDNYYSLKSEFYIKGEPSPLSLLGGESPNDDDFKNNGFDEINDLVKVITTDSIIEIESNAETLYEGNLFRFNIPDGFKGVNTI